MGYIIKELTKEMVPSLAALEKICFTHPWTEAMFRGDLESPLTVYRGIFSEDKLVAYMGMWCVADEGQITNVAVHPDYRRKGLAKQLIEALIAIAKEKQLISLTLEVRKHNEAAISLYETMGFCS